MELRIFLPRIHQNINNSRLVEEYILNLNKLLIIIENNYSNNSIIEQREDKYLMTKDYFGLKYRSGNKLELKIRCNIINPNIEYWIKKKYGHKSINHYINEIEKTVKENTSNTVDSNDFNTLNDNKLLTVMKSRKHRYFNNVIEEICYLNVYNDRWISICYEGEADDIKTNMKSINYIHELLICLRLQLEIVNEIQSSQSHKYIAVVSGFPAWINLISSPQLTVEHIDSFKSYLSSFITYFDK